MQNRHDTHEELTVTEYLDTVAEHAGMESKIKTIITEVQAELKEVMQSAASPFEKIAALMSADDVVLTRASEAVDSEVHDNIHHQLAEHSNEAKDQLADRRVFAGAALNSMFAKRAEKAAAEAGCSSDEELVASPATPRC